MNRTHTSLLTLAILLAGTGMSWAQTATELPTTQPAATPKKPDAATPTVNQLNPEEAMKVDKEDLTNNLLNREEETKDPMKILERMLKRMDKSADQLSSKTDPGSQTQEIQRRIDGDLAMAIELVRQQQQKQQQQQQSESKEEAQKKQQSQQQSQGQGKSPSPDPQGNQAAQESKLPPGSPGAFQANGQNIKEGRQEWGNLPQRERELIVNGAGEEILPSYRDMVQKYYRALAEVNKTARDR
ncbi:MAG: hypothetical protein WCJ97_04075 [Phycisphaerae bacterium]